MVRWAVEFSETAVSDGFIQTLKSPSLAFIMQHTRLRFWFVTVALSLLSGCGDDDSPEQRVRELIAQVEVAAEARDTSDVTQWLSPAYRDAHGNDIDEVKRLLRGYFIANQSIRLLTRVEELTFPNPGEARANVLVGMVSREADAANAWELAADLNEFEIALAEEDGQWRVTWARWRRSG